MWPVLLVGLVDVWTDVEYGPRKGEESNSLIDSMCSGLGVLDELFMRVLWPVVSKFSFEIKVERGANLDKISGILSFLTVGGISGEFVLSLCFLGVSGIKSSRSSLRYILLGLLLDGFENEGAELRVGECAMTYGVDLRLLRAYDEVGEGGEVNQSRSSSSDV